MVCTYGQPLYIAWEKILIDQKRLKLQCPIENEVRPYFTYKANRRWYRLTALPMGANFAPAIMHQISEILADVKVPEVSVDVYIDNIRFHGNVLAVLRAVRQFRNRVARANCTLNQEKQNSSHSK